MKLELIPLALLMGLVTYPSRAVPLLMGRVERMPPFVLAYLRLVGPAVLAALAAVNTMVPVETLDDGTRHVAFHVGIEWVAVGLCLGIVAKWRNLLVGILVAVAVVALARAAGIAPV
jgi:branched-subunit amino acid transport protein